LVIHFLILGSDHYDTLLFESLIVLRTHPLLIKFP
jgi:hypothetical protein